jgi:Zn-dependent peptidase ImmA (M78 family)
LANQYAHIGDGGFEAVSKGVEAEGKVKVEIAQSDVRPNVQAISARPRQGWSDRQIELKVRTLQRSMWQSQAQSHGIARGTDPIALLDPEVALADLGYECRPVDSIGIWGGQSGMADVAGQIDTVNKIVLVSDKFSRLARKFTVAHELGHAVMHQHLGTQHQDKLLNGSSSSRDKVEREANRFATLFLMPAKLLRKRFTALFLADRFVLSEDTAFALAGDAGAKLLMSMRSVRELARLLAEVPSYNGRNFDPLHVQFGVSREAMAIRLEELSLV